MHLQQAGLRNYITCLVHMHWPWPCVCLLQSNSLSLMLRQTRPSFKVKLSFCDVASLIAKVPSSGQKTNFLSVSLCFRVIDLKFELGFD